MSKVMFGLFLQGRLEALHMDSLELAELLGVPEDIVVQWIENRRSPEGWPPSLLARRRLAKALEVPLSEIEEMVAS